MLQLIHVQLITAFPTGIISGSQGKVKGEDKETLSTGNPLIMFEYFNEKAIRAVMLAQEEARRTQHNLVGSEHLLLGIIGEGTATAAMVLNELGVTLQQTRRIVENWIGAGMGFTSTEIPFTPKVKNIFEKAFQEARQLGHPFISPEHFLLAIAKLNFDRRNPDRNGTHSF